MPVLLLAGGVILVVGIVLFFLWFGFIWALAKAILPVVLMAGGAVATYLGWEEWRDRQLPATDFSNPSEANRYQAEAVAYQAEINDIQHESPEGIDQPLQPEAEAQPPKDGDK